MASGDVTTVIVRQSSLAEKLAVAAALVCKPCCGGGSGSGSGGGSGLTNCCGCPSFPSTLAFTLDIPCFGTKVGTLTKNTALSDECVDNPGDLPRITYGFTETNGNTSDSWTSTDCSSGLPVTSTGGVLEDWSIDLTCCPNLGTPPYKKWYFRIHVQKIAGGEQYNVVWNGVIDILSCAPIVFESLSETIVCIDAATPIGICGFDPFGDYYDLPISSYTNCVGSLFNFDVSE